MSMNKFYKIMKKNITKKNLFILFLLFLLQSCSTEDFDNDKISELSIEEAQEYFENNVIEFHWFTSTTTRAKIDEEPIITPMWESGEIDHIDSKQVIDIPLDAPITVVTKFALQKILFLKNV